MNDRVLFLVTTLNGGGLENYVLRFLTYKNNLNTHIVCKGGEIGDLECEFRRLSKIELLIPLNFRRRPLISYFRLFLLYKKYHYNAVCDFTGSFAGFPLLIAKIGGIQRRIAFYRNSSFPFEKTKLKMLYFKFVTKLTKRCATVLLSNSHAAFDFYYGKSIDHRFKVIYNGVDPNLVSTQSKNEIRQKLGIPQNAFVIGHTGRYAGPKNHVMIFNVATRLCNKYENLYFLIIGKGVPLHKPHNSSSRIICLDYSKNVMGLLKGMDLFYFPSISEGQPNALIEAMITGLPVVASNIPPIQETVPENLKKKLISPFNEDCNYTTLEKCFLQREILDDYVCKEWALRHFNASSKFEEFYKELV